MNIYTIVIKYKHALTRKFDNNEKRKTENQ